MIFFVATRLVCDDFFLDGGACVYDVLCVCVCVCVCVVASLVHAMAFS